MQFVELDHARVAGGPSVADAVPAAAAMTGASKINPVAIAGKGAKRLLRM
jgi:hypothetical protein